MYNHPMTPAQTNASPASGHPHGEDFEMGSPSWPRTPASPVFNSHAAAPVTPQDSYRSTKVKVRQLTRNQIKQALNSFIMFSEI